MLMPVCEVFVSGFPFLDLNMTLPGRVIASEKRAIRWEKVDLPRVIRAIPWLAAAVPLEAGDIPLEA
jgi:hypothetical protein